MNKFKIIKRYRRPYESCFHMECLEFCDTLDQAKEYIQGLAKKLQKGGTENVYYDQYLQKINTDFCTEYFISE